MARWFASAMIEVRRRIQRIGPHGSRPAFDPDVSRSRYLQLGHPPTAVEAAHRQLLAITEADEGPEAHGYLDPATVELYEQHRQPRHHHPKPNR